MESLLLDLLHKIGFENIETKDFQITNNPIQKDDRVLGDMNELEKACHILLTQRKAEHTALHKEMDGVKEDSEEGLALATRHYINKEGSALIRNIMWMSVATRFGAQKNSDGWALREGNKVVARPEKEEPDFFAGFGGMTIIQLGRD